MATNTFDPHGNDDLSLPPAIIGDGGADADLASHVIREKLDRIYAEEPEATKELKEAAARTSGRSKHQQFMYNLGTSGKDLAAIQTEWHAYYEGLPDEEKHAVWREFYASQSSLTGQAPAGVKTGSPHILAKHKNPGGRTRNPGKESAGRLRDSRNRKDIQEALRDKVTGGGKLETKHHVQSLLFGLGIGLIVVIIFLFGFFNEVFIAPFIQPSRTAAATPLIVNSDSVAPSANPEVIIPKINVQIPVNYTQTSTDEAAIESDLEHGVVHYPTTAKPGETGNSAIFGHSSNNIFNKGKYKFAFVLLHTLVEGDTFYLTYNGKVYAYKVISKKIVDPSEVGVLNAVPGQTATATLITCDPPGTSLHRLVVVGQQISPDPAGNTQGQASKASGDSTSSALPGNGPTLWGRFIGTSIGKASVVIVIIGGCLLVFRRINGPLTIR